MNTGLPAQHFKVTEIIKDSEFGDGAKRTENFFKFMWSQSAPLFKGSHLRNILTASFIQFAACNTTNGFWTFLPEILNKVSLWNEGPKVPATVCRIFHANEFWNRNQTEEVVICKPIEKLELSTFIYVYGLFFAFSACYVVMSLLINRVGKLSIILAVSISCGLAAFSMIFLKVPEIISYVYIFMILAGLIVSVVNASTVELFPTKMRFVSSQLQLKH